ncbi:hypothetical protein E3P86_03209 [Wallemia ichthyophaga]|uniref:Uncharacterized protein n=1 Tax=Wallemia ichthyophaga TaxID=245174 RepID=A0A4T0IQB9_WALIC|nr:hypothetical protein E3P86_03209 [Wallemia ichthyophaga]
MAYTAQVCNRQATPRGLSTDDSTYHADPDSCECSVPYYNLAEACVFCGTGNHNRETSMDDFFYKCRNNGLDISDQFPSKVTDNVAVPPWATIPVPASGNWSYENAESYASDHPTPTETNNQGKPSDKNGKSNEENSPEDGDHNYSVGAVVGGTLGSVAAVAIVIAVAVLFWCRRSSTAARRRRLMMRAQGVPKVKGTDSVFEIDDDESTQNRTNDLDKTYIPVPYTGSITGAGLNAVSSGRVGQHSQRGSQPLNNLTHLDEDSIYSKTDLTTPVPAVRRGVDAGYSYKQQNRQTDAGVSLRTNSRTDSIFSENEYYKGII